MSSAEPRGNAGALALGTAAFTICFFAWSMLGPLGPTIQDHLKLTDGQLALLIAVPVLMGSLMRIPLGVLTDRYGGRAVFTGLLGFTLIPTGLLAIFHTDYTTMLVIGFFLGFAGASFAVGVPFVSRWYPRARQGAVLGIYGMGMGGTVIAGLTAPWMAKHWGLAAPFLVAFGIVGAMALAFAILARDAPGSTSQTSSLFAPLGVVREDPRVWAPTFYYFVVFGGFVAMFAYLPKLLHGVHHLTKTDAGARAAGFALVAVLARPVGGWLADRIGPTAVLRMALGGTVLLAIGLAFEYGSMGWITACCLTMGLAFGLGTGAVFKLVAHDFPTRIGVVTGIVGAAGGLGGFFPPIVMAWVKTQTNSYQLGFLALAVTALLAVLVLELSRRRREPRALGETVAPDA